MKNLHCFLLLLVVNLLSPGTVQMQSLSELDFHRVTLPNGWGITPVGTSLSLGDLPLNMVVSPSGKILAVTNNGQSDQTLQLIDIKTRKVLDTVIVGKAFIGLAFSSDSKTLYASGGNDNWILKYDVSKGKFKYISVCLREIAFVGIICCFRISFTIFSNIRFAFS